MPTMGPQGTDTLLALLREAEAVGGGVLYEKRWGLAYQRIEERYNQSVGLALDFDQGHIAEEPEPADDDQRTRNRFTASRFGGSEYTAEQTTGPMGTGTEGPGLYADSATYNTETDAQLKQQAEQQVLFGTVDEDRYPSIALNFTRNPALIDTWTALGYGARITIDNPLPEMPPGQVDQVIEGHSERWDQRLWRAWLNCSPFSPYRVFVLAESTDDNNPFLGYMIPTTCLLAEDLDTTETGVDITTTPLWATNSLILPGTFGNNASTPDNAALDIVGDIDLRADVTMDDWTPAADKAALVSKWFISQASYILEIAQTTGLVGLSWSNDGTATITRNSTVAPDVANGERLAVRATLDVDNGAAGHTVTFYTAPTIDGPWTQLGAPVVTAGTTNVFSSTTQIEVGSVFTFFLWAGIVHAIEIRNGIGGTAVANPSFIAQAAGTTSFADAAGRTWTVNGSAAIGNDDWTPGALITIGGEDMTVTGVAGGSNPQTLTVTRAVNSVVKSHSAGATVAFKHPGFLAL